MQTTLVAHAGCSWMQRVLSASVQADMHHQAQFSSADGLRFGDCHLSDFAFGPGVRGDHHRSRFGSRHEWFAMPMMTACCGQIDSRTKSTTRMNQNMTFPRAFISLHAWRIIVKPELVRCDAHISETRTRNGLLCVELHTCLQFALVGP
jgi:hypothetical protein